MHHFTLDVESGSSSSIVDGGGNRECQVYACPIHVIFWLIAWICLYIGYHINAHATVTERQQPEQNSRNREQSILCIVVTYTNYTHTHSHAQILCIALIAERERIQKFKLKSFVVAVKRALIPRFCLPTVRLFPKRHYETFIFHPYGLSCMRPPLSLCYAM